MAHDSQNTQKVSPSPPRCLTCLSLRAPGVVSVLGMSDVRGGVFATSGDTGRDSQCCDHSQPFNTLSKSLLHMSFKYPTFDTRMLPPCYVAPSMIAMKYQRQPYVGAPLLPGQRLSVAREMETAVR